MQFQQCSKPLAQVFEGEKQEVAAALHAAFVSYHVGIRQEALSSMVELVNKHSELPTLALLLGNMLAAAKQLPMAHNAGYWRCAEIDRAGQWLQLQCNICAAQRTAGLRLIESSDLLRRSSRRGTGQRTRPGPVD